MNYEQKDKIKADLRQYEHERLNSVHEAISDAKAYANENGAFYELISILDDLFWDEFNDRDDEGIKVSDAVKFAVLSACNNAIIRNRNVSALEDVVRKHETRWHPKTIIDAIEDMFLIEKSEESFLYITYWLTDDGKTELEKLAPEK